ncbi:HAMP domain-containing sensor histidine kinase [Bacteroides sp. 519]|uniref:sensor histidine kinase n=1 Tax=Bacteroides sp. 519 TaxID=2302937 RepID=UPI0013D35C6B|nr:HAMP domain-containing sensor histidine kinase [Bacteroides sp. 519]NDV57898.1 sensor histidine kinase [Bacteroides sp. 519]
MNTVNRNDLTSYLLHFIEQINSDTPFQQRIEECLSSICTFFHFKRGFVYQTDGFRFFYLKETFGNENNTLRKRFEIKEMSEQHTAVMKEKTPFWVWNRSTANNIEHEVLDFYRVNSLFIHHAKDMDGKTIGFIGFADNEKERLNDEETDILNKVTGLLTKEIAIREYNERDIRTGKTLESIMNNMGVDIYVNSFDNHDMLYVNQSMAAPYGGQNNFKGQKCWKALYKDKTCECEYCPKAHLIDENGNPTKAYSWDYQRPFDKSWFRVFSAAFEWTDGQLAHVITSVDITHQKHIENELRLAKEKAENLDRLKSAFLANMSHEIRTPLNSIVGFSELLAITENPEERKEYNQIVQENNKLLLQLISDILDLSRIEADMLDYKIEPVNVNDLCYEITRSYEVHGNAKVPIVFDRNAPAYIIDSDKKRLTQVITNFINNAIKFTSEGEITLNYHLTNKNYIEFYVKDTGTGIKADNLNEVFERFAKFNTAQKGTGLGLTICKSIVEHLGGNIGVESEVGVGSRFWFTHPYKAENNA